jgi:hypothetical protein
VPSKEEGTEQRAGLPRLPPGRHGLPREFVVENQRQRIAAGMIEVVVERGYLATTVTQVVAAAGVSRRTFYNYYAEFLEQGNIGLACTRPVLQAHACPAKSVYGKAKAWSPLLEKPLEGPVYLVGGYGYKLPAMVAELDGQIRVLLVGKVDTGSTKGIRNTFEAVPDAPVEKFTLELKGGKKYGLLVNSEDICKKKQVGQASFTAQNGKVLKLKPVITNSCGKKAKGTGKKHKGKTGDGKSPGKKSKGKKKH